MHGHVITHKTPTTIVMIKIGQIVFEYELLELCAYIT